MHASIARPSFRLALGIAFCLLTPGFAQSAEKIPLLIDTDIGSHVEDAFALGLLLASPEVDVRGITTVAGDTEDRAWMVCRMLTAIERKGVPVAVGRGKQPGEKIGTQFQYRYHPAVIFNRTNKPAKEDAVELLYQQLKADPGKLTILALGPLTNIAQLFEKHPDCTPWVKRLVYVSGNLNELDSGLSGGKPEYNASVNIQIIHVIRDSKVPQVVIPPNKSSAIKLSEMKCQRIFAARTQLTYQLEALYQLDDEARPALYSVLAAAFCIDEKPFDVNEAGLAQVRSGEDGNITRLLVERLTNFGKPAPARPPGNVSKLVERRGLPARVHAFENYDTDIERRWWMAGKAETRNVPPGGVRACRGVLTMDFDDRQGDLSTNYVAVIFNPVPGPPMGKNTRLSFRYWLKGTDTIRVQLYSLSNGYHRYLSVHDLPQEKWQSGTVDMTAMRRPDGTGGPLAADERIDDIQFYVDPKAEIVIDDVVLYDEAPADEKQPFPGRFLFTGWFDTGAQGKEWPGDFEIVPHTAPLTWKAAKSVTNDKLGTPWIRVSLRGERPLGKTTNLRFRYRLSSGDQLKVVLRNSKTDGQIKRELKDLKNGQWEEAAISFESEDVRSADELQFHLPKGAELLVDDVLLYEPAVTPK